jgi:hypothetical protein
VTTFDANINDTIFGRISADSPRLNQAAVKLRF